MLDPASFRTATIRNLGLVGGKGGKCRFLMRSICESVLMGCSLPLKHGQLGRVQKWRRADRRSCPDDPNAIDGDVIRATVWGDYGNCWVLSAARDSGGIYLCETNDYFRIGERLCLVAV